MTVVGRARTHVVAVQGLLVAGLATLGVTYGVYLTEVPASEEIVWPYAVLHPGAGRNTVTSLSHLSDRLDQRIQVTCVGQDPVEALAVADTVREILLDVKPTVTGRSCWQITELDEGQDSPVLPDRTVLHPDTHRPVFYVPVLLQVASVPA